MAGSAAARCAGCGHSLEAHRHTATCWTILDRDDGTERRCGCTAAPYGHARELELGQVAFAGNDLFDYDCFEAEDGLRVLAMLLPNGDYPLGSGPYGDFGNDVFALRAYCWCDGETHPDGCPPNFEHHPSGLKINFYKHIGRGMSSNRLFDAEAWVRVLWDCLRSIDPGRTDK